MIEETQSLVANEIKETGPRGYSAYEVAVQNDFDGTEQEWLDSLVGATGPQGATGPKGDNGLNGVDGKDGKDATNNYNDLINKPTIPSKTSELTNDSQFVNKTYVDTAVEKIFDIAGNIHYVTVNTYAELQAVDISSLTDGVYIYLVKQDENYPRVDTPAEDDYYSTIYIFITGSTGFEFIGKLNVSEQMLGELISSAIATALTNYYTKTEITNFGYQNATQVNALIETYVNNLDADGSDY